MSLESFNRLVRLAARAFYDDITLKGDNQPKNGRSDNRGMAVVVLDALTRRQWVREEDLAKALKLHSKQLRRTLRYFEEEKLVTRDHRKETAKGAKVFSAAVAATADSQQSTKEGDDKLKMHTHSYCCLDYAQIYDVVRYRMHKMKKKLKDELENRNTIQEYICPSCKRRYSALDVAQLISPTGEYFSCEKCNTELVAESDKLATEEIGEGDDNARRRNREKLKVMLQKLEEQLKPLTQQLARVKDLPVPEFGSLQSWEVRANVAALAMNSDPNANDPSKSSHGQGGTPMPFLGETRVEVALSGVDVKGEVTDGDPASAGLKVLPPWMIKQGMVLTSEQRGEVKPDIKTIKSSLSADEKKPKDEKEDQKSIENEYYKAYYAELYRRQQELEMERNRESQGAARSDYSGFSSEASAERRVGMKAKREDDEEDVEWEDTPVSDGCVTGGTGGVVPRVTDLNIEAAEVEEAAEDDDDEIDWEEG